MAQHPLTFNPEPGPQVQWESHEQAMRTATVAGGVAGSLLGVGAWYMAAKAHPVGKYVGIVFPVAGAILVGRGWRNLVEGGEAYTGEGQWQRGAARAY